MRDAGILFIPLFCLTSAAFGQVSVDMKALDSLGPEKPAARLPPAASPPGAPAGAPIPAVPSTAPQAGSAALTTPSATPRAPARTAASRAPAARAAASPSAGPGTRASQPAVAAAPAPVVPAAPVASAPVPALPAAQPAEPPASTTVPATQVSTAPLPPPVRLMFETGKTDLTPQAETAIRELARSLPAPDADSVNVMAYAAGKPDDPSTARRLSLSRGMAVRSVLLDSGVKSTQIYVRALGSTASDGPADRVELTVSRIGTVTR